VIAAWLTMLGRSLGETMAFFQTCEQMLGNAPLMTHHSGMYKPVGWAPGAVIENRESTFWERYRRYVLAATAVFVAQASLIIGLLWQRARKRKAEAVLPTSAPEIAKTSLEASTSRRPPLQASRLHIKEKQTLMRSKALIRYKGSTRCHRTT
jgi:hypothetical protein